MRGTFTINRQQSDDVNRAIETAVARMSFVTRPIARGRLRRSFTLLLRTRSSAAAALEQA